MKSQRQPVTEMHRKAEVAEANPSPARTVVPLCVPGLHSAGAAAGAFVLP